MRLAMEERLDMHAVDIYGLSEVIGPGVAQECVETKDGLHVWEDHFYPEIIDPVTGEVLPDGEQGELVFTSLTKEAMPVIRYRTRDLTRLLPGTARPMRRIEKITGRTDDMIILRGVNLFPTQIEELACGCRRWRRTSSAADPDGNHGRDDGGRRATGGRDDRRGAGSGPASCGTDQGHDRRDGRGGGRRSRTPSSGRSARCGGLWTSGLGASGCPWRRNPA